MDKLTQKHRQLLLALNSLEKSISSLSRFERIYSEFKEKFDYDEEYKIHRDSVIQRFEYSIDMFWKYIKKYLEESNVLMESKFSGDVVREACVARLIFEDEAEILLVMIKSRNKTSHIYVEAVAALLASQIPEYFKILNLIAFRIGPKI
ncbi:MAG: Nucleotidyltransferase substrate binding protein, HI0074 family [candidate division TM6 bacterium GW2011_GWF2_37_49]|nr:MAG: Nucleotidyltransferase substrate binding protein, HI0074 family [candidate division TM6 bacterium GW2011_GWF2_37_49]